MHKIAWVRASKSTSNVGFYAPLMLTVKSRTGTVLSLTVLTATYPFFGMEAKIRAPVLKPPSSLWSSGPLPLQPGSPSLNRS